ncbi:MAG: D-alanyl-D-alanine carboxypeptidase/D-alanyl-D-alanine-endopeptidase, partial [Acidobacteriota bacterium]
AAALDRFGPGFFFETPLLARGTVRDGVLWGDLAVIGGGDPNLSGRHSNGDSYAFFREWAAALKALGIHRVDGEIFLVHGLFDDQLVHPDWPKDQLDRWYEAPVAALSFNDNCVLVKIEPIPTLDASPGGGEARVGLVPDLPSLRLAARVRIVGDRRRESVKISRSPLDATPEAPATFSATGAIHRRTEKIDRWVPVADPVRYFGAAWVDAANEEGVRIDRVPRPVETLPAEAVSGEVWRQVAVHRSDLLTTLEVILERSQNFYAESVVKLLGARQCGDGSWDGGLRVVHEVLDELGLDPNATQLADGSGMSRGNRSTPRQLTMLLRAMRSHRWSTEWMRSLPFSGQVDLRWEKRLAQAPYRGNVLAKTGTLRAVSTLSGYAKGRSGRVYAFSLLMNRSRANWRAQDAQDAILRALIDHG